MFRFVKIKDINSIERSRLETKFPSALVKLTKTTLKILPKSKDKYIKELSFEMDDSSDGIFFHSNLYRVWEGKIECPFILKSQIDSLTKQPLLNYTLLTTDNLEKIVKHLKIKDVIWISPFHNIHSFVNK